MSCISPRALGRDGPAVVVALLLDDGADEVCRDFEAPGGLFDEVVYSFTADALTLQLRLVEALIERQPGLVSELIQDLRGRVLYEAVAPPLLKLTGGAGTG